MNADFLITNIGQLVVVPPGAGPKRGREMRDLGIVRDAVLAARDGVVVAVGPRDEVMPGVTLCPGASVVDAGGRLVGPGFVDAHTHLVFAGWRHEEYAMRSEGRSYLEIAEQGGGILSTVRATRNATLEELEARSREFLDLMLASGTTTAETKSGYGLTFEDEVKQLEVVRRLKEHHPVSLVSTFLGAHAVPEEYKGQREAYVGSVIGMLPEIRRLNLAEFVDVFCDAGAFTVPETERILRAAGDLGFGLKVHADELEWTGATELACRMGATSCDHLLRVSDEGMDMLARRPLGDESTATHTVAVLLPATSVFLGKTRGAPARALIDRGAPVALGTDFNPGTCTALSMPLVMTLACSVLHMSPEEAFTAATLNAAWAVGLGDRVGSLERGYEADIVVFDACDYREIPYRFGWNPVSRVYKKGREVWSKRPVVED
ncbi:MAG: imidazolonepropionase [Firmicutes bacterium]|nr:imidazolonepropionase [Candidatus Fermentithermobacillaceae bacterium]